MPYGTSVGAGFTIIVSSPNPDVTKPAPYIMATIQLPIQSGLS
ncbi:MAG: hypothetical protein RIM23_26735 [Coleofasciculus sp. G3-WIS-01]